MAAMRTWRRGILQALLAANVGVDFKAAGDASKAGLAGAIGCSGVATTCAALAGALWRHCYQNATAPCLLVPSWRRNSYHP